MAKVFFFWITYCICNQNIYTFGINQEIVRDICNNRGRSKLLIVSKYMIRTCLLVYLRPLTLQMLLFPTNCLYCGSQPRLLININNWTLLIYPRHWISCMNLRLQVYILHFSYILVFRQFFYFCSFYIHFHVKKIK